MTDEQIEKYKIQEGTTPEQFPRALIDELVPGIYNGWALQFLNDLQDAHDSADPNENFVKNFKYKANLAEKWNLKALV